MIWSDSWLSDVEILLIVEDAKEVTRVSCIHIHTFVQHIGNSKFHEHEDELIVPCCLSLNVKFLG